MDKRFVVTPTSEGFGVLVFGRPGAGKTLFAASGYKNPGLSPVLFLNSDHGTLTVAHLNAEALAKDEEPPIRQFPVDSLSDLEYASREMLKPDGTRDDPFNGVKLLVFDSLTSFRDSAMREEAIAQATKQNAKRTNVNVNELQDYNAILNALMRNLFNLRQTGVNMVFTAGSAVNTEGRIAADLNPKMGIALNHFVSNYWYIDVNSAGKRAIQVVDKGGSPRVVKTRGVPFSRALGEITNENGFYTIPDDEYPTLSFLYDLFMTTTMGEAKK